MRRGGEPHYCAVVVVRREGNGVWLCHGGYFQYSKDAAASTGVRIDNVSSLLLENRRELLFGKHSLACDYWYIYLRPYSSHEVHIVGQTRLLVPEGVELVDPMGEVDGVTRGQAPMNLDEEIHIGSESFSDGSYVVEGGILVFLANVRTPRHQKGVPLQSAVAHCL